MDTIILQFDPGSAEALFCSCAVAFFNLFIGYAIGARKL